jgi:hypothetical protein
MQPPPSRSSTAVKLPDTVAGVPTAAGAEAGKAQGLQELIVPPQRVS